MPEAGLFKNLQNVLVEKQEKRMVELYLIRDKIIQETAAVQAKIRQLIDSKESQ